MGVFVALCGALWCLFGIVSDFEAPLWHLRRLFGKLEHVGALLVLRGSSGLQFGILGRHFGTRGRPFLCFLNTLWRGPEPFKHCRGKGLKKELKNIGLGSPAGSIFIIF